MLPFSLGSNVLMMWYAYPMCMYARILNVFTDLLFFYLQFFVVVAFALSQNSVQKPIIIYTGKKKREKRPSEWKQSSLSSRKMHVLSKRNCRITLLHLLWLHSRTQSTRLNVLNRDSAGVKISFVFSREFFFSLQAYYFHCHFVIHTGAWMWFLL